MYNSEKKVEDLFVSGNAAKPIVVRIAEPDDFVDGIYCPGCRDQMSVKEVEDEKCSECGAELGL